MDDRATVQSLNGLVHPHCPSSPHPLILEFLRCALLSFYVFFAIGIFTAVQNVGSTLLGQSSKQKYIVALQKLASLLRGIFHIFCHKVPHKKPKIHGRFELANAKNIVYSNYFNLLSAAWPGILKMSSLASAVRMITMDTSTPPKHCP